VPALFGDTFWHPKQEDEMGLLDKLLGRAKKATQSHEHTHDYNEPHAHEEAAPVPPPATPAPPAAPGTGETVPPAAPGERDVTES
jgi:hypothetical protein